jgi:probable addiction module antidote protein
MAEKFTRWDAAEDLETEEDMRMYFDICVEDDPGDGSLIRRALGDIARARGMTQLAKDTGLAREGLYKALSADGNPEFTTIMKVVKALGLKFHAGPVKPVRNVKKARQPNSETISV